ncbi:antirestriction protein [Clostridioides difficile]|nr:antirestriction protein ArdA [Clostridioides difficile]
MQETRVLVETSGTTGEEITSYWFDLPIEVAEFEEMLGVGAESGEYRIIEKALPFADEVHEHTSVYQLNELDYMYRQLSSDMQEEYTMLHTVYENLEALYICRNVITLYPDCKNMIDVARQKLMNDPTFKHLSEDCQAYYFDFEAYASHLQEHGKFLVTEHGIFELPE